MKFLKGLALSLLSFLLFLSLAIFGLVLTLNYTILNPDFVVSQIDKLDISSLAEEVIIGEIPEEELRIALTDTITKFEPLVKEQVSATIYPVYDYLLGKSQSLDLALTLGDTILNPDFAASLVDELDVSLLMGEFIGEQIAEQIPVEELPEELRAALDDAVNDTITELEPWIKEQAKIAIYPVFDYLLGKSQGFSVVISLEPVKESLRDNLKEAFLESLPQLAALPPAFLESLPQLAALPPAFLELLPQLAAALPPALIDQIFDMFYQEFSDQIPPTFEFNQSLLGTEIPAQIAEALAVAEVALVQARQYIGYVQTGYRALIGFILLLILGIIFINRQVRGATRGLGVIFLTYGAFEYAGIFAAKYFAGSQLAQFPIPSQLQAWIPQLLNDFLAPLQMFSLGLLAAGVVLLIVSFVYKPRQPSV